MARNPADFGNAVYTPQWINKSDSVLDVVLAPSVAGFLDNLDGCLPVCEP